MNTAAYVRAPIDALPVHVCQKFGYEWMLRAYGQGGLPGKELFDFGPGGYPFSAFLAKAGAAVSWYDRNPKVEDAMLALEKAWKVALRQRRTLDGGTVDIIIASNAVQHNRTEGAVIFHTLRKMLKPGGCILLSEKLAQGQSRWIEDRADPCWARTLGDHLALWQSCGLAPRFMAGFIYTFSGRPEQETGHWTSLSRACQLVARLERDDAPC